MTSITDLVPVERTVPVVFGDTKFEVTYRPREHTVAFREALPDDVGAMTLLMVERWDLQLDDDAPLPVDEDSVAKVPIPVLRAICAAILRDTFAEIA